MNQIMTDLEKMKNRLSDESFLKNKGLSNEVGIHVFCYDAKDEMVVRDYFKALKQASGTVYNIVECDLYKIFISICEDKKILKSIDSMEEKKGRDFLLAQLQKVAAPEMFVQKMKYEPHNYGDVLVISGVGEVYPFMRVHKILDNIQHVFSDIPVVVLYPGKYNGQELSLFGDLEDGNYYRAFNML